MKRVLTISVIANLVLAGLVVYLVQHDSRSVEPVHGPSVSITNFDNKTATAGIGTIGNSSRVATDAFRWAQLESTNYRTYVANLRSIGCPEQTIRDLITADVHSLYAPRFQDLDSKKNSFATNRLSDQLVSRNVEMDLDRLRGEETAVIAAALSLDGQNVVGSSGSQRSFRSRVQEMTVSMPLVLQEVNEQSMKLDAQQREIIADLRAKFQQDIGGPNQNPNDPAYRERWQKAQRDSDDMLAGMLGGQFFVEYQLHAGERSPQSQ